MKPHLMAQKNTKGVFKNEDNEKTNQERKKTMKNANFKTKLIARIMLLVLLLASALILTACPGGLGSPVDRSIYFESKEELVHFVEKYNSKNDGFVYTFVAFDFDNHNQVETFRYTLNTMWKSGYDIDKMYDKNHNNGFRCAMIFYISDINAQITCKYSTNSNYNFYQGDEITIQFVDVYQKFEPNGVKEEWADQRTFNIETLDYDKYYEKMYVYQININGNEEVILKINVDKETSIEELDAIAQLFVDNIVIINTEG